MVSKLIGKISAVFRDILKTKDPEKPGGAKFSQSRLYLLGVFIALLGGSLYGIFADNYEYGLDTLYATFLVLAMYALGSKGMSHIKDVVKKR